MQVTRTYLLPSLLNPLTDDLCADDLGCQHADAPLGTHIWVAVSIFIASIAVAYQGNYVELPGRGLKLGKNYVESTVNLPIYETARRYTGPVLVIQGSHDRVVPYTYAVRYVEGYKDGTLKIIPDEDHSFTKNTAEAALYASDWLAKQLQ